MKALVPGSFDPPTMGHAALIALAQKHYGEVTACIMVNADKKPMFSVNDRLKMLELCTDESVKKDFYGGWCYEYCREHGIDIIVRGYRNAEDYFYETEMARFNREKTGGVDTFLFFLDGLENVSATHVRELLEAGSSIRGIVPAAVERYIKALRGSGANETKE